MYLVAKKHWISNILLRRENKKDSFGGVSKQSLQSLQSLQMTTLNGTAQLIPRAQQPGKTRANILLSFLSGFLFVKAMLGVPILFV